MSYRGVGHVIFSLHLGVGRSVLFQLEEVGDVSHFEMLRTTAPPPPPLYFLTSPVDLGGLEKRTQEKKKKNKQHKQRDNNYSVSARKRK